MSAAEHRIGRVVFEIAVPDHAALSRFGEKVRACFDAVVVPALQAALDRIDRPGAVIRLDRVEIDLGSLESATPAAGDLARHIADGLAAALTAAPPLEPTGIISVRDDAAELAAYLETGEVPWSEPGRALATLAGTLMTLDAVGMARLAARLRTVLIRKRAAERLVQQLPAVLVLRLLRALLPEALAAPLTATVGPDGAGRTPSAAPVPDRLASHLAATIHRLAGDAGTPELGSILGLFAALDSRPAPAPGSPPAVTAPRPEAEAPTPVARPALPADTAPRSEAEAPVQKEPEVEAPDHAARSTSRPVHLAGAVLLYPFLGRFFDQLGLLDASGQFRDPTARARAVLLAHHLATGKEEAPEPETTLLKLLCGMEPADLVPRRIDLSGNERAEADALLTSVIGHWTRLGNTSPDGLREGFLTRPGQLERQDGLWRLRVEPRSIDVLLDGLPWTLSRVRTPFMQSALAVDWR